MTVMKNIPLTIGGDTVVGLTSSKKVTDLGWHDMATLSSWYQDDPDKNHLGLIELFSSMSNYRMPAYKNIFKNKSILEVVGYNGKFTYDLRVTKPSGVFTNADTSRHSDEPGKGGSLFPIKLSQPFTANDVLTYDNIYGEQVFVSADIPVTQDGDSWLHWVSLVGKDEKKSFPKDKLSAGIQYFKVGHGLNEYATSFSSIQAPYNTGTIKNEVTLGNHRGVETFYTAYSDVKTLSGATKESQDFWSNFIQEQERLGKDANGYPLDMFFIGKLNEQGKIKKSTMRLGSTLEWFALMELMKIEYHQLMFQKAGTMRGEANHSTILNEGWYHQIRRGRIIKYARPGGITRNHIKQASSYVFRNRKDLLPHERRMKFKCGIMAYYNVLNLFKEEVRSQINALSSLLGADRVLPKSPVKGKDLTSLEFESVMFTKVPIPEIGHVEIEHDPSLDYRPLADRHSAGFYGEGYPRTSYSMIIEDAMSEEYSNARTNLPKGTKLVDGGKNNANLYYVKPVGVGLEWGYEAGRYAPDKSGGIVSSLKKMGRGFWCHNASMLFVPDPSRFICIEL